MYKTPSTNYSVPCCDPCEPVCTKTISSDVQNIIMAIGEIESVTETILAKIDGGGQNNPTTQGSPSCISDGLEYTKNKLERIYDRLVQINSMV